MTLSPRAVEAAARAIANFHATGVPNGWSQAQIDKAEAKAALTAALAVDGMAWQPAETAPKDGTEFIACNVGFQPFSCVFDGQFVHLEPDGEIVAYSFTHWMPLPQPPSASDREERK